MYCQISGEATKEPVFCKLCGGLFEKRLVEQYIADNGRCPSGDDASTDDLMPVKGCGPVQPRPIAASSIPAMLQLFQNEWDATMLETYNLKQQLESTREELAHALYQVDAASRVIARLMKERDEARAALANVGEGGAAQASADTEITSQVLGRMKEIQNQLAAGRKTRPYTMPTKEQIAGLEQRDAVALHKASKPAVNCVAVHQVQTNRVLTGGDDFAAVLFDSGVGKKLATLAGHSKKVTRVALHPALDVALTASADRTARVWSPSGSSFSTVHVIEGHSGTVTGLGVHPLGDYAATSSSNAWAFHDIRSGNTLATIVDDDAQDYTSLSFHPDGMLVGTASSDGVVRVWDMNDRSVALRFDDDGGATSFAFSENGYLMVGASSTSIKLWDLRKQKTLQNFSLPRSFKPTAVSIDYSGAFTAVSGAHVKVLSTKTLEEVVSLSDSKKKVNDVTWTRDSSTLLSVSHDKNLRFYRY